MKQIFKKGGSTAFEVLQEKEVLFNEDSKIESDGITQESMNEVNKEAFGEKNFIDPENFADVKTEPQDMGIIEDPLGESGGTIFPEECLDIKDELDSFIGL